MEVSCASVSAVGCASFGFGVYAGGGASSLVPGSAGFTLCCVCCAWAQAANAAVSASANSISLEKNCLVMDLVSCFSVTGLCAFLTEIRLTSSFQRRYT